MDSQVDAVAGLEARVKCHFQQLGSWMPFNPSVFLALLYISNRSGGGGGVASCEHMIAQEVVNQCLAACRSRRNLEARLANRIFFTLEKASSNCWGVCSKMALNCLKVKVIYSTCMKHYPLDRLEIGPHSRKDMRNTITEVCWKTKIAPVTKNP